MRFILTLVFLAGLAGLSSASAERRLALVVGNNAYQNVARLSTAVNDARAMQAALSARGFSVTYAENVSRRELNAAIQDFAGHVHAGDVALFFFAGHGVEIDGRNYLLPADIPDARPGQDDFIADEAVAVDGVLARLQTRNAGLNIVVLDACRDNPFARVAGRSVGTTRGLARMNAPAGTFIMYSADAGQEALDRLSEDDPSPNSVFTRTLIPLLGEAERSLVELARETRRRVRELAATVDHEQTPAYYDAVLGDFYFGSEGGGSAATSLPADSAPQGPGASEAARIEWAGSYQAVLGAYGQGSLTIADRREGGIDFGLEVYFENTHSCALGGSASSVGQDWRYADGGECILDFVASADGSISLRTDANATCSEYCGARASLNDIPFRKAAAEQGAPAETEPEAEQTDDVLANARGKLWAAADGTAIAITGDIKVAADRITFYNGESIGIRQVPGAPDGLFEVAPASDPVLRRGNRLCGSPVTYVALARTGKSLVIRLYETSEVPSGGWDGMCAQYSYYAE